MRPVVSLGFIGCMPSRFYPASVVFFQLHGGMVSIKARKVIVDFNFDALYRYVSIESLLKSG